METRFSEKLQETRLNKINKAREDSNARIETEDCPIDSAHFREEEQVKESDEELEEPPYKKRKFNM